MLGTLVENRKQNSFGPLPPVTNFCLTHRLNDYRASIHPKNYTLRLLPFEQGDPPNGEANLGRSLSTRSTQIKSFEVLLNSIIVIVI